MISSIAGVGARVEVGPGFAAGAAETLPIELYLDHACPWSYMAFTALRELCLELGLAPAWRLLPIGGSPDAAPAEARMHAARLAADWPEIAASAMADFGLRLRQPAWPGDGRLAAAALDRLRRTAPDRELDAHAAVFAARFESDLDIADPGCLSALLEPFADGIADGIADLDRAAVRAALAEDAERALRSGVRVVPTLVLDRRHLLLGAEPTEVLRLALAQLSPAIVSANDGPDRATPSIAARQARQPGS